MNHSSSSSRMDRKESNENMVENICMIEEDDDDLDFFSSPRNYDDHRQMSPSSSHSTLPTTITMHPRNGGRTTNLFQFSNGHHNATNEKITKEVGGVENEVVVEEQNRHMTKDCDTIMNASGEDGSGFFTKSIYDSESRSTTVTRSWWGDYCPILCTIKFGLLFLMIGIIVTLSFSIDCVMTQQVQRTMQQQFHTIAYQITDHVIQQLVTSIESLSDLSHQYTMPTTTTRTEPSHSQNQFPFVTLSFFGKQTSMTLQRTKGIMISQHPIVSTEQRIVWEEYVTLYHQDWM
jgi:hypothetical protein